ncbi:putative entry exclusion protein TrbK-alt [Pararhizobium sp. IMCC21322]|uniref:putative entry exclusion protein TrbK-alt n=1 Tax=Pararhizobium sp. IMCC21322 TaxID=3067903 RepID=UPI00274235EC|nr:putative entry exclusion protein TrbK-alt [Pararhizobium sp. IMCC21322]
MTMGRTALPRLAAAVFLMIAIVVAVIELGRDGKEVRFSEPIAAVSDPLSAELQRCQALGDAALEDKSCLDVWAENRRRFLTPGSPLDGRE